jgi:outer membrane protein OmpA-like peptidoglycan-associated protein
MALTRNLRRATLLILALVSLSGCLTPTINPTESQAIKETLARSRAPAGSACPQNPMAELSPVMVGFAFGEATLPTMNSEPLTDAAKWMACHAGVAVVIKPEADGHGTDAERDALARQRAEAVQAYLTAQHVDPARIQVLARGAKEPAGEHFLVLAEGRRW